MIGIVLTIVVLVAEGLISVNCSKGIYGKRQGSMHKLTWAEFCTAVVPAMKRAAAAAMKAENCMA